MTSNERTGLWAGIALVVVGLIALVHNLWPWWFNETFLWAVATTVVAAGLFVNYHQRRRGGLLVLAWGMLGVAGTLFLNAYGRPLSEVAGASFVLGWSLGFLALHLHQPDNWWPAFIGGTLFVLTALVALADLDALYTYQRRFVFFFGMALVFGYIYLGVGATQNRWAGVSALVSLLLAALFLLIHSVPEMRDYVLPGILILLGIWLTVRGLGANHKHAEVAEPQQPAESSPEAEG